MLHFGTPASGPLPGTGRRPYIQTCGIPSYERRCAEIINQTALLVSSLNDADLGIQVPSTPDWTLNQLLRHVGHAHRWADSMLRDRLPEIDFSRNGAQLLSSYEGERVRADPVADRRRGVARGGGLVRLSRSDMLAALLRGGTATTNATERQSPGCHDRQPGL
ncbi:maleylpyruvate isomerase N-terminal domain-containing protein [Lentzea albidocapillata]|uniref:Mycothiol maleylpyruvate isomerase N-terminal domain-containing protein n=1 Tax=Lentzea albidocapillata TaxID=40571 RepID=A0A1W2FH56_9PSEU|nr:Mycothiol maleylpyruvate isomerase N-terminal domain-containing protein [Lentzea albidocapillata]